jgi:hypothetical protein
MRALLSLTVTVCVLLLTACWGGDDEPVDRTAAPPSETPASPTPETGSGELFTEPRPRQPDASLGVPARPASPFSAWDRESVVLYDLEQMTERSYGRGFLVSFSADGSLLAMNLQSPASGRNVVRVVTLATGETRDFDTEGGFAAFVDEHHLYMPGQGEVRVLDIRSGESMPLRQVTDPVLRVLLEQRAGSGVRLTADQRYSMQREIAGPDGLRQCQPKPAPEERLCRAEAFEHWKVTEVATGAVVLELRAYEVVPGAPGEILVATSPRCRSRDGSLKWCEEVLLELRQDDPPGSFQFEYAEGTVNIFSVDIASGRAEFIATASFRPNTQIWPANWPLIANERHIVWTGGFCAEKRDGTQIYDRRTRRITQLDQGFWVKFTPGGDLGVDEFGPRAILDIETFQWKFVLPELAIDVAQSPDGRYLAVAGVLGHGGLCG